MSGADSENFHLVLHVTPWSCTCGVAESVKYILQEFPAPWQNVVVAETPNIGQASLGAIATYSWQRGRNLSTPESTIIDLAPAIVHFQWFPGWFKPQQFTNLVERLHSHGTKVVATIHLWPDHVRFDRDKTSLGNVDAIVATTSRMLKELSNRVNLCTPRLQKVIIPLPSAPVEEIISQWPDISQGHARRCLGYSLNEPLIVSIGKLSPYKGHLEVLRAILELRKIDIEVNYWVAGFAGPNDLDYLRDLRAFIDDNDLTGCRVINGWLNDKELALYCLASDAVALHYMCAGLSGSAMARTALACGRPIIGSDSPMLDDLGPAVLRPKMGAISEIREAILYTLDEFRNASLCRNAKATAAESDPKTVAAAYSKLYHNLISENVPCPTSTSSSPRPGE